MELIFNFKNFKNRSFGVGIFLFHVRVIIIIIFSVLLDCNISKKKEKKETQKLKFIREAFREKCIRKLYKYPRGFKVN